MKSHYYVVVTGTMGSGKSTATKLIASHLGLHLLEENFGANEFLPRFYEDMKRWSFHSQTFYLMEKINQLLSTQKLIRSKSVVQDTPLFQDVFSYAKALHVMGNMSDAEWKLYQKIYRSFADYLPRPTHFVYLKTSLDRVKERINKRSRTYEQKIPDGYLELLEMLNESWMKKEVGKAKMIVVETDNLNLVRSKKDIKSFVTHLKKELKIH